MIAKILTTIVFIAEIIITYSVISTLFKLDKKIIEISSIIFDAKNEIKDITLLMTKISEQIVDFSEDFVQKLEKEQENAFYKQLNKILITILLWKINIKVINKFRKTKTGKLLGKGFSVLQNMV